MSLLAVPLSRYAAAEKNDRIEITLEGRAADLGNEVVSFGLPLPYGFLNDPHKVMIVDERGIEFPAAVRSLEPWRTGGKEGSIRSLLIQFKSDFSKEKTQRITVTFNEVRPSNKDFVPVSKTLIEEDGLKGPRVLAVLPAEWLCASGIVGPQIPANRSGVYSSYDRFVEKNFPGSLAYLDSKVYHEWLYDRTSNW